MIRGQALLPLLPAALALGGCGEERWTFDGEGDAGSGDALSSADGAPKGDASGHADARIDAAPGLRGGCTNDSDCAYFRVSLYCDVDAGECVECTTSAQCREAQRPPFCDRSMNPPRCVECIVSGNCPPGLVCNTSIGSCAPSCIDGGACPLSTPFCNQSRGYCVLCDSDMECAPNVCDNGSGQCVQCVSDRQCSQDPALPPYCNTRTNQCVRCLSNLDCPQHLPCDPTTYTCLGH